jgi:hypothetical protein
MDGNAITAAPNVVNGMNVDDLFALIEGVKNDPANGKTQWRVATTWQGQARSRAEVEGFGIGGHEVPRHFTIDIDEPCELGDSNRFANPQEHRSQRSMPALWWGTWRSAQSAGLPSKISRSRLRARSTSAASRHRSRGDARLR